MTLLPDEAALDHTYPGWRFAQNRVVRAGMALRELEDWELSGYVARAEPVPSDVRRALVGSDWARVCEWNAALAQRALVAPLMAGSQCDVPASRRPGGMQG